jgi:primosomal protein N' (replication factor Y) (superfamily II helicase)
MPSIFVDVVLPSRRNRVFTYRVPGKFHTQVSLGSQVLVPLGSAVVTGVVVSLTPSLDDPGTRGILRNRLRDLLSVQSGAGNSPLPPLLIRLAQKVAEYYVAPFSSCLPLVLPPPAVQVAGRVFLTDAGKKALAEGALSGDDSFLLRKLERRSEGLLLSTLNRSAQVKPATIRRLKKHGWLEERVVVRDLTKTLTVQTPGKTAVEEESSLPSDTLCLGEDGLDDLPVEWAGIARALSEGVAREQVCVGTEWSRWKGLARAALLTLERQRQVIVLAPEVRLVEVLASRCRVFWGERVGVFHGDLSPAIKAERWRRMQQGEIDVVVGTRSAVFVPLPDVGLIWVEREEDGSYLEEHIPYYHARTVARLRGELERALVVYGSSQPSVETYQRFRSAVTFSGPTHSVSGPAMEIVNIQQCPYGTILAPQMLEGITRSLARNASVILFLNRKGFSHGLVCKECGHVPVCPTCNVTLKLFRHPSRLVCAYCGRTETTPEVCVSCRGTIFQFTGVGTQRLEEEIVGHFPSIRVARFDRDNLKSDREADAMLDAFRQGHFPILLGTEWLFHRWDPPRAEFVGLPQADMGLHVPDFRSAERTYHLLRQAVDMAGQDSSRGEVVLQTRMPDHHVLQAIVHQNPEMFYQQELTLREVLGYPPFSQLLLLVVSGVERSKVASAVEFFRQRLEVFRQAGAASPPSAQDQSEYVLLGPIPSQNPRGAGKTRTLMLLKTSDLPTVRQWVNTCMQEFNLRFPAMPVVVEIHVDPLGIQ